jgi:hypothetical protein
MATFEAFFCSPKVSCMYNRDKLTAIISGKLVFLLHVLLKKSHPFLKLILLSTSPYFACISSTMNFRRKKKSRL